MTSGTNVTMLRALAWKEWREQRSLVVAGLALALLIPILLMVGTAAAPRPLDLAALAGILPAIYIPMLWPLLSAAAGAATFANEIGDGTLGFLLSRPASRARVWGVKVAMAFLAGLLILLGSLVVAMLIGLAAGAASPEVSGPLDEILHARVAGMGSLVEVLVSATLLLFATSVFFSTFLSRAMTAAAAGVAASLLILTGLFLLWTGLELVPRLEAEWMALEVLLIAGLILLGSLFVFSRGELLRGSGSRRLVIMAALGVIGGAGLVTAPLIQLHGRLTPETALVGTLTPSRAGDAVLAAVTNKERLAPQIWLIHTDGSGMERLTGSLTYDPAISADGTWIAYLSQRGPLGLRSSRTELRVVRANGSEDRPLATLTYYARPNWMRTPVAFSPDGSRVAALGDDRLVIASLEGGSVKSIDLTHSPFRQGSLGGWLEGGEEVLVLSEGARWSREGVPMMAVVDVGSGAIRILYKGTSRSFIWLPHVRPTGWKRVPIIVEGRLLLVDPGTSEAETITDNAAWWSPVLSDDGNLLVYAVGHRVKGAPGESGIHLRDLATGADVTLSTAPGLAGDILLSPSNESLIINRYVGGIPIPSLAVTRTGRVRELPSGWICLGWQGRERIILAEAPGGGRLAVADLATTDLRTIFP